MKTGKIRNLVQRAKFATRYYRQATINQFGVKHGGYRRFWGLGKMVDGLYWGGGRNVDESEISRMVDTITVNTLLKEFGLPSLIEFKDLVRATQDNTLSNENAWWLSRCFESIGWQDVYSTYLALPAVVEAALKANLAPRQIVDLIVKVGRKAEVHVNSALRSLPGAFQAAKEAGLTPWQIVDLFGRFVEKPDHYNYDAAFKAFAIAAKVLGEYIFEETFEAFPSATKASCKTRLAPEQIYDLFVRIADKAGEKLFIPLGVLPSASKTAFEIKLSPGQFMDFFVNIFEETGNRMPNAPFCAFPAALEAKFSPDQYAKLIGKIAEKNNQFTFLIFENLPVVIETAQKAGLAPGQIVDLLEWIGGHDGYAIKALPEAIKAKLSPAQIVNLFEKFSEKAFAFEFFPRAAKAAREANLTPDQIFNLFGIIAEKTGGNAGEALSAFPVEIKMAQELNLPSEQMVDLLGKIAGKTWKYYGWRDAYKKSFEVLPAALEAKLTANQIGNLFGEIAKTVEYEIKEAFEPLPMALEAAKEANLTPEQIAGLFSKIIEKAGKNVAGAFDVLPRLLKAKLILDQIPALFEKIDKEGDKYFCEAFLTFPEARQESKLTREQMQTLYQFILEHEWLYGKETSEYALEALPIGVNALQRLNLTSDQIVDFIYKVVKRHGKGVGSGVFRVLPRAVETALEAGLSKEQIQKLFARIVLNTWGSVGLLGYLGYEDGWGSPAVVEKCFSKLPNALGALKKANLSVEQIAGLLEKIVEKSSVFPAGVFINLSPVVDSVLNANFTPPQIIDLFGEIVEKSGKYAPNVFGDLPGAIEAARNANFVPPQIIDLLGEIAERSGKRPTNIFACLPETIAAAAKAGLSSAQTVDLCKKIVQKFGRNSDKALKASIALLEERLPSDQIVRILSKTVS